MSTICIVHASNIFKLGPNSTIPSKNLTKNIVSIGKLLNIVDSKKRLY